MTPALLRLLPVLLLLPSCSRVEESADAGGGNGQDKAPFWSAAAAENRYGFEEWYGDFPYPPAMPAVRKPGAWYDRSRAAALRKVADNLEGGCSQDAWRMAREFFDRCQDEAKDLLIETMDRGLTQQHHRTLALNAVKVMGRVKNDAFADALLRAVEFPDPSIREAAITSMIKGGNAEVVRKIQGYYLQLSLKERLHWMKASIAHLPDTELAPILKDLVTKTEHSHMRLPAIQECIKMPPARTVRLLADAYDDLPLALQVIVAPAFHAVGDPRGLGTLRKAIRGDDRKLQAVAVEGVGRGKIEPLLDEILELTNQERAATPEDVALRVAIINTIRKVPGQRVNDVLLIYTVDVNVLVRQAAYQALHLRGEDDALEELVKVARTGTGLQRTNAIADLVSCRYEKVVPILKEAHRTSNAADQMAYIRELARFGSPPAFAVMKEIFMAPERELPTQSLHTNVTFLGIQLSNMEESVDEILVLLESLPRTEYRRRAALVHALANAAGAYYGESWSKDVYRRLRQIMLDRKAVPQLRLLALQYLLKDLRLDDAMELKRALARESRPMRSYFSDYLSEYF